MAVETIFNVSLLFSSRTAPSMELKNACQEILPAMDSVLVEELLVETGAWMLGHTVRTTRPVAANASEGTNPVMATVERDIFYAMEIVKMNITTGCVAKTVSGKISHVKEIVQLTE